MNPDDLRFMPLTTEHIAFAENGLVVKSARDFSGYSQFQLFVSKEELNSYLKELFDTTRSKLLDAAFNPEAKQARKEGRVWYVP